MILAPFTYHTRRIYGHLSFKLGHQHVKLTKDTQNNWAAPGMMMPANLVAFLLFSLLVLIMYITTPFVSKDR